MTIIYLISPVETSNQFMEERRATLTMQGKHDCVILTKFFEDKKVDAIYSSPYMAAIDTIRPCANRLKLPVYIVEEFKERVIGQITESLSQFEKKQWQTFSYHALGGECLEEVRERMIDGIAMLANQEQDRTVIVSTHTNAMCMAIQFFDESFQYEDYLQATKRKPGIVKFTFDGETCLDIEEIMCM